MKKIPIILFLFFTISTIKSQENTVSWTTSVEKNSNTEYTLIIKAKLNEGWHLYSQNLSEGGPLPTVFTFENQKDSYELIGKTTENKPIVYYEEIFKMETSYFETEAIFKQKIKILNPDLKFVKITVSYQTCNDEVCTFEPGEEIFISLTNTKIVSPNKIVDEASKILSQELNLHLKNKEEFLKSNKIYDDNLEDLWNLFLLGFLGGLISLLTPCVFPMIPLTVSFFAKKSGTRKKIIYNAILYGFFITLIYLLLTLPFHFLDSLAPEILNNISTNVWLNILFFVIIVVFAFSFFGYFDITLPHSWSDKVDSASKIGGIIGIFFIALTLAIVSFSCTGPILGSLLVGALSSDGSALQLTFGMFGFGSALAFPFTIFALFPNWINSLPKSGGWLNTIKVTLGFLEMALALKFLSNADMVENWGLLKREVFIGIWILIFIGLSLYLFGKLKFPHDKIVKKLGKVRIITGIISLIFTCYLISGLFFNTSLNFLSGFAPPKFYSLYKTKTNCPLDLNCFKDFNKGLSYSKTHNKPILLDFTGWACVNCRKMEENIWSHPEVYAELQKYVLISLYVDDRKELPKKLQFNYEKSNGKIKRITTVGSKWATLQTINFNTAAQPFYVLISPDMELLNYPEKYTDKKTYLKWLKEGLKRFEN